jgi:hypothetical protein
MHLPPITHVIIAGNFKVRKQMQINNVKRSHENVVSAVAPRDHDVNCGESAVDHEGTDDDAQEEEENDEFHGPEVETPNAEVEQNVVGNTQSVVVEAMDVHEVSTQGLQESEVPEKGEVYEDSSNDPAKDVAAHSMSPPQIEIPPRTPPVTAALIQSQIDPCLDTWNKPLAPKLEKDVRICEFCREEGDNEVSGRMLDMGSSTWVHGNCALWSNEVFEGTAGELINVRLARSRIRTLKCCHCQVRGASVGCCYPKCIQVFHYRCAHAARCYMLTSKEVFCLNHTMDEVKAIIATPNISLLTTHALRRKLRVGEVVSSSLPEDSTFRVGGSKFVLSSLYYSLMRALNLILSDFFP